MKKFILTFTILIYANAYSQTKNDCNYKITKDDFEKSTTYSYRTKALAYGLTYDIYTVKKPNYDYSFMIFSLMGMSECVSKSDSSLSIMFEDGSTSIISFKFGKEDLQLMTSKKIKKIRITFQSNRDYEILDKRYEKFKENINCLLEKL